MTTPPPQPNPHYPQPPIWTGRFLASIWVPYASPHKKDMSRWVDAYLTCGGKCLLLRYGPEPADYYADGWESWPIPRTLYMRHCDYRGGYALPPSTAHINRAYEAVRKILKQGGQE